MSPDAVIDVVMIHVLTGELVRYVKGWQVPSGWEIIRFESELGRMVYTDNGDLQDKFKSLQRYPGT